MMAQYKKIKRRKVKKRRYRLKWGRFTLFCLSLFTITWGLIYLVMNLIRPSVDLVAIVTEDKNQEEGTSEFEVKLSWGEFDSSQYDSLELYISTDLEPINLSLTEHTYSFETDQEETEIVFELIGDRKGLGLNIKEKVKVTTLADNQSINQEIIGFQVTDTEIIMTQRLLAESGAKTIAKSLVTDLVSPFSGVVFSEVPTPIEESNTEVITQLNIPLSILDDEIGLEIMTNYEANNTMISSVIRQDELPSQSSQLDTKAQLEINDATAFISNNSFETKKLDSYHFTAESLQLLTTDNQMASSYTLVSRDGEETEYVYGDKSNEGIELSELNAGTYFIQLDDLYLNGNQLVQSDIWYTVKRDGLANAVRLEQEVGRVVLIVESISDVPEEVYDIIIDPGHGGLDSGTTGNDLLERDEVIKVSTYIANRLSEYGLKVKLTRKDEFDPTGEGNFDYVNSPYMENGRVE